MIKPYYSDEWVTLYLGDCRALMPDLPLKAIDLVLTDPPYPDAHLEYGNSDISFLSDIPCRQLIFWSAKTDFPFNDYTAIHIWDKQCGCGSMYERLFERNGQKNWRVLHANVMNSTMAASYGSDVFYGHPSQKPQRLISKLVAECSNPGDLIFDPFSGVGTTAWCAKKLGRRCIGIEINEKWIEKSAKRCSQTVMNFVTDNVTDNRRCQICKTLLTNKRRDAVTCSDRCRQALKRLQVRVAGGQ
jgi:DNA modification methylase/predicted nucleic acid-binding Zn ribbon protein